MPMAVPPSSSLLSQDPNNYFSFVSARLITVSHLTLVGETINYVVHYFLDYGITANFISKTLVNFLQLVPISKLKDLIRSLDTKTMTKTPLLVYLLQLSDRWG